MTGRQILENLKKLPEDKLDLPVVVTHGASGVSYEVGIYGEAMMNDKTSCAGVLIDLEGEYIWGSVD